MRPPAYLKLYAAAWPLLGAVALLVSIAVSPPAMDKTAYPPALLPIFAALAAVAVAVPLRMARERLLVVDDATYFAAALLLGPATAMLSVAAGAAVGNGYLLLRRRRDPWSAAFNAGKATIAVGAAATVYWAAGGGQGMLSVAAAAVTLYVLNTFPTSLGAALQRRCDPFSLWLSGRRVDVAQSVALYVVGLGLAFVAPIHPWAVLVAALPMAAAHYTLRQLTDLLQRQLSEQALETMRSQAQLEGALLVARTVAHEINNALSPVVGYTELLAIQPVVTENPQLSTYVRRIGESGQLVAERVQRLQHIVRLKEDGTLARSGQRVLDLAESTA